MLWEEVDLFLEKELSFAHWHTTSADGNDREIGAAVRHSRQARFRDVDFGAAPIVLESGAFQRSHGWGVWSIAPSPATGLGV